MSENAYVSGLLDEIKAGHLSRRAVLKRAAALGLSAPVVATLLAACGDDDEDEPEGGDAGATTAPPAAGDETSEAEADPTEPAEDTDDEEDDEEAEETPADDGEVEAPAGEGTRGGRLVVASIGEPQTLDEHQTTAGITAEIGYCMYETLFAYDSEYNPIPMLAESYDVSDDGLNHTITLRQGVMFHNGQEMTSADVIASLERWGAISGVGTQLLAATEEITAVDDYTIEMVTSQPYGTILIALCSNTQACVIYPASVIEAAGADPLTEFIGTGPYRFAEQQADAFIRFERFEDYVAIEGEPNGYGGHKYAYVDEIEFVPVPDEASRVAGMQAGDYHIAMEMSNDQYDVLRDDPALLVEIRPPSNWDVFFLNWAQPLMGNHTIRKAFQAALDHMPILQSSRGGGDFVRLDPSLMLEPTPWYSTAGEELYNVADPELAAQYLEEAGYDGTPIRFMCTQEYAYMYGAAVVAQQQLEQAGFVVDLQVTDWATVLERRGQREVWDVFITGHGFVPDPSQITYVGQMNIYPGWWNSEESLALAAQLLSEPDFETRYELWEQIQVNAYEEIPAVKTGDSSVISVWSATVGGYTDQLQRGVPYWNVWLEG